ncbi:MAG: PHP domain-containing protein [Clostridiaceae bacterium]|nr:PHP domain-containing protein [Clostridiaceae bacterium]
MRTYKYDVHVHTSEVSPCGRIGAREVVNLYKEAGYDGIVITDHYFDGYFEKYHSCSWDEKMVCFLEGYRKAREEGKNIGLNVLLGIELRFVGSINDYLVFGVTEEFLKNNPELYKLNLQQFNELKKGHDILIYQAHPFRPNQAIERAGLLDGIEVYNGNPRHDSRNYLAYSFALEDGLRMISGSDCHQLEDVARGGIVTMEDITDEAGLVEVLRKEAISLIME